MTTAATDRMANQRGVALVAVLLLTVIFMLMLGVLLMLSFSDRVMTVNEADYTKTLGHAEAGIIWAQRRVQDARGAGLSDLLDGPNNGSATDDYLLGLRDLSLTATSQFTNANENTASAIVTRDFGDGSKSYEVVRLADGPGTRALVYVRIDDNFDDDPADPANNVPLVDTDSRVRVTAVAEYPVFVNGSGAEMANSREDRGRAVRILVATFGERDSLPAILTDGKFNVSGNLNLCGPCGSAHANDDLAIGGSPEVCEDGTATSLFSNSTGTIHGDGGSGYAAIPLPVINPYDDIFVPDKDIFTALSCGVPTAADPGNSKYFALVIDSGSGKVFKAYWDFVNDNKWTWKLIDDLSDATDVVLDNCGRAPGDPSYGVGVVDGVNDEFYGFKATNTESLLSCVTCGNTGDDASLCTLSNNDFGVNGYYETGTLTLVTSITGSSVPALPGSFAPDTQPDFDPENRLDSEWTFANSTVYSPLYGAVIWSYGRIVVGGDPGKVATGTYCDSGGCVGSPPGGIWPVSLITYSDIHVWGEPEWGPAAPPEFTFLLVAGRDLRITDDINEDTPACGGSPLCNSTAPAGILKLGGVYAAHEQLELSDDSNIFGFMVVEEALDCSSQVNGLGSRTSTFSMSPEVFYDCVNPANPWAKTDISIKSWREID